MYIDTMGGDTVHPNTDMVATLFQHECVPRPPFLTPRNIILPLLSSST